VAELHPSPEEIFSPQARAFQDRFDTRRLADRLVEHFVRREMNEEQADFIRGCRMLFLATVGSDGRPDCSYKGGRPGFVRLVDDQTLVIPFYDGNGMFAALGNIEATGRVGLLFIDFESSYRLRVNGTAVTSAPEDSAIEFPGALVLVTVHAEVVYDLCERYVHKLTFVEESQYCPAEAYEPPPAPYLAKSIYDGARPGEGTRTDQKG
jgi:predicted pyridoxine 5'-phosphate oxidase superfamily flavin-nucleotide-binding protein